ncbi:NUDIX hydrolase [Saccharicrinis sp. GN24d3]|uniref:NUDIX hydrolase n=1 Tax=Saccharicrinis sp. GN24d3 TaxID=3458416 RepID=UPI00403522F3
MDFRKIDNVSVDCVIFGLASDSLNILLSKRTLNMFTDAYPVIDDWVVTGHHIFKSETLDECADRIFREISGFSEVYKKQFRAYGNPSRIQSDKDLFWVRSRGGNPRTMTVAYYFLLPMDKIKIKLETSRWFPIKSLPGLGFDHRQLIDDAYADLQQKIMTEPIIFDLLPDKFTLNELQVAFELVLDIKIDNRNFRKKALSKSYIVPLEEKRLGVSKKPAKLYMFSKDVYERLSGEGYIINI